MWPFLPLLHWLDANPTWHLTFAWTLFALLVLTATLPLVAGLPASLAAGSARRMLRLGASPWAFAILVPLSMAAFRWPFWFDPQIGNPDEAQMIAGAITLAKYPVFWGSVDGTTHGPLSDYVLLLPWLIGAPIDFVTARIVALVLEAGALLCLWRALRLVMPEGIARVAILPGCAFWSFVTFFDLVEYSSELVAQFLAAAALWALASATTASARGRRSRLFVFGSLIGLIPYAKLQGVPLVAALALLGLASILGLAPELRPHRRGDLLALALGVAWFSGLTLAFVLFHGVFDSFWAGYITNNLLYANSGHLTHAAMLQRLLSCELSGSTMFTPYFLGSLAALLACAIPAYLGGRASARWLAIGWLLFLAGVFTTISPRREFTHYLHFMVVPLGLFTGVHLAACVTWLSRWAPQAQAIGVSCAVFLVASLVPPIVSCAAEGAPLSGRLAQHLAERISPVSQFLLAHQSPGDRLALWGWMPHYHVETGLPQATREAHSSRQIEAGPMQDYYRRRYLRDIRRSRPRWFVDAVGGTNFAYTDRSRQGHEILPELAAFIAQDYELVADLQGSRIYRRLEGR